MPCLPCNLLTVGWLQTLLAACHYTNNLATHWFLPGVNTPTLFQFHNSCCCRLFAGSCSASTEMAVIHLAYSLSQHTPAEWKDIRNSTTRISRGIWLPVCVCNMHKVCSSFRNHWCRMLGKCCCQNGRYLDLSLFSEGAGNVWERLQLSLFKKIVKFLHLGFQENLLPYIVSQCFFAKATAWKPLPWCCWREADYLCCSSVN